MKASDNTLGALVKWLTEGLSALYGEREALNISREVFRHLFGLERVDLVLQADRRFSEGEMLQLIRMKDALQAGKPLQYLTGKAVFMDLELEVTPAVLIPRPETEELVNAILLANPDQQLKVLDIGTGSGCIALALKQHRPEWELTAWDVSGSALEVAAGNASRLGLSINFELCNVLEALPQKDSLNLIVSNPPYIPQSESASMRRSVTEHEPSVALFTPDDDPMLFYRTIVRLAQDSLVSGGQVWFEIHEDRADEVMSLFDQELWQPPVMKQDLQGKARIVSATLI